MFIFWLLLLSCGIPNVTSSSSLPLLVVNSWEQLHFLIFANIPPNLLPLRLHSITLAQLIAEDTASDGHFNIILAICNTLFLTVCQQVDEFISHFVAEKTKRDICYTAQLARKQYRQQDYLLG